MRSIMIVAWQTIILMLRDKVFVPVLVILGIVGLLASMAGDLSTWDARKVVLDIGLFGFHITGGVVAIFWGAKSMNDSKTEGSIETQLASTIPRSYWLFGKYLGLTLTLVLLAISFLVAWQGILVVMGHPTLSVPELTAFASVTIIWLMLTAVSTFFATFCNLAIVIFSSLVVWFMGVMMPIFAEAFQDSFSQALMETLAQFWNLKQFIPGIDFFVGSAQLYQELLARMTQGALTATVAILCACLIFNARDIKH